MAGRVPAGRLLAIDTATSRAVLAIGAVADGALLAAAVWPGGHAHAETILPRLSTLLESNDVALDDIVGLVVGIGPGAFTGLRVGLATAKTLAHGLRRPIVGVGTGQALATAAGLSDGSTVVLPAGPRDRYLVPVAVHGGVPSLVAPAAFEAWLTGRGPDAGPLVAVDLDDAAIPAEAGRLGATALDRLPDALLRIGAAALAAGHHDDVAALVPAYVALPRGVPASAEGGAWSPDLR